MPARAAAVPGAADPPLHVPVLVYHRFAATPLDSMTVTIATFIAQLQMLDAQNYRVIRLTELLAALRDPHIVLPARAVVLTADDGHVSVFTQLLPLVRQRTLPVTLFVYPSAVSNASYALTWQQLTQLQSTGLFDIQSHSFWHPNFNIERRRLTPAAYRDFVVTQLARSRSMLQAHGAGAVDALAWPFGIYDAELMRAAQHAGYGAAFTIERRHVTRADNLMALPRYLITNADTGARFLRLLAGTSN